MKKQRQLILLMIPKNVKHKEKWYYGEEKKIYEPHKNFSKIQWKR